MGAGKKRKRITLRDLLARPWCYYCERDFDDQKILVDHQKAKHFHCQVHGCHRKLGTAGGLRVHMQQVHKEELQEVPNAMPGREDPNVEVFAMIGIPEPIMNAYNKAITDGYEAHAHRFRQETGNFLPGSIDPEEMPVHKKKKTEPTEEEKAAKKAEILRRKEEVLARKRAAAGAKAVGSGAATTPAAPVAAKPVTPVQAPVYNTSPAPQACPPPATAVFPPIMVQPAMPPPIFGAYPPAFPPPMPPSMSPNMPQQIPYGHATPVSNVSAPVVLPFMPPPGVRGPPMPPGFSPPPAFSPPAHLSPGTTGNSPAFRKPSTESPPPQASKPVADTSSSDPFMDGISQLMDEAQATAIARSIEPSTKTEPNIKAEPSASQPEKATVAGKKKADKGAEKTFQPLADNTTSFEEARARVNRELPLIDGLGQDWKDKLAKLQISDSDAETDPSTQQQPGQDDGLDRTRQSPAASS
ncbi:uncharacterized protein MYCFIDRAFT_89360 [Pseudocercospora fijiensis CIRAD86]|uniref:C2H2-type domain-containing protein n=1 Tax=Pseudocercospora fijiensis (strain CIRAD86) TaxID=383855 RepID=M3AGA7_PSEFD|nr:uncharacterized protein MYCFIDRAFT_89360 [Pseudocercospora fijiensis CIRAD86]EME83621.1 hypothetical protein MYCFIDRAFT_89360 [Pseudocercospora fijiensis CIRAD86]